MRFPTDPKLLAFLPFTAFLFNHIDEIGPSAVVFLFAPGQEDYVTQIAETLAGRQMRIIGVSNQSQPNLISIKDDTLLLSFIGVCHHDIAWLRFESNVRTFMINVEAISTAESKFENVPHPQNPYPCIAWPSHRLTSPGDGMLEADFLKSFNWSIFTDRLTTLDGHQSMTCVDDYDTDRMGTRRYIKSSQMLITTGFRIGIYKILRELLRAKYMRYYPNFHFAWNPRLTSMTVSEERLTAVFYIIRGEWINKLSLIPHPQMFPYQFSHGALRTRYRVVVPRIVLDTTSNRLKKYWMQTLVVLGLMLTTGLFVVIRLLCRLGEEWPVDVSDWWVYSFFDTWARTLSNGAGPWLGRSTAERQLLTVIAVFAFLAARVFTGVLYEQLLVQDEVRFLYNSLDDICLAGMVLRVPHVLMPGHSFVNQPTTDTVFLP